MSENVLFRIENETSKAETAKALREAADDIAFGGITLVSDSQEESIVVPENLRFKIEFEQLTNSETGEQRYELKYGISWTAEDC